MLILLSACVPGTPTQTLVLPTQPRFDGLDAGLSGVTVRVGSPSEVDWTLTIAHAHLGREGEPMGQVPSTQPTISAEELAYDHGAVVSKWLQHPRGLEQTFDVLERPPGDGQLRLQFDIQSDGALRKVEGGVGRVDGNHVIGRYDGLVAFDAVGQELPSRMEADCVEQSCVVRLLIDDSDAVYPLWVDPLVWTPDVTVVGGTGFGRVVRMDDTWAMVASDTDIRFYERLVTGWTLQDTETLAGVTSMAISDASGLALVAAGVSDPVVYSRTGTDWAPISTSLTCGLGIASELALDGTVGTLRAGMACDAGGTTIYTLQQQDTLGLFLPASVNLSVVGLPVAIDFSEGLLTGLSTSGGVATLAGLDETLGTSTVTLATDASDVSSRSGVEALVSTPAGTLTFLRDITGWLAGQTLPASDAVSASGNNALLTSAASTVAYATVSTTQGWSEYQTGLEGGSQVSSSATYGVIGDSTTDTVEFVELLLNADVDGDGFNGVADGGDDCDDTDEDINPDATEIFDNDIDENCDGFDAEFGPASLAAGDLVFSEVMSSPFSAGSVDWVELQNRSGTQVDLLGIDVDIDGTVFTVNAMTPIDVAGFAVLSAAGSTDYTADHLLVGFAIPEPPGVMEISAGATTFDSLTFTPAFGTSVGATHSLDPDETASASASRSWCDAWAPMVSGDFGTPGAANEQCDATFSFDFHWFMSDTTEFQATTTLMLDLDGRFETGNSGTGTAARTTSSAGQLLTWTYDRTGVTYNGLRAFGDTEWCTQAMTDLPVDADSGTWGESSCP